MSTAPPPHALQYYILQYFRGVRAHRTSKTFKWNCMCPERSTKRLKLHSSRSEKDNFSKRGYIILERPNKQVNVDKIYLSAYTSIIRHSFMKVLNKIRVPICFCLQSHALVLFYKIIRKNIYFLQYVLISIFYNVQVYTLTVINVKIFGFN